jgi:riboflavin synthase
MFTGLVLECGRLIGDPEASGQGGVKLSLGLSSSLGERLGIGSSLAVAGVCLTVTEKGVESVVVELSPETLSRTSLGGLSDGDSVNLEPALRMGDELGGHWVQGHVDATILVVSREDLEDHRVLGFGIPDSWAPYIVEKGSVTLDGVSLTVSRRRATAFEVALIPHTLEITSLNRLQVGDAVNLEVDIIAKHVEQLLAWRRIPEIAADSGTVLTGRPD